MSKGDSLFHFGTLLNMIILGLIFRVDGFFGAAIGFSIGGILEVLLKDEWIRRCMNDQSW